MEDAINLEYGGRNAGKTFKTELQLQAYCFQWHWNEFPADRQMLHNNDNNSFNGIEGARKKALGVVKGASDFEYIDAGLVWFLEFKLPGGKQSPEQIEFQRKVEERGHKYLILFSFAEFKSFIIKRLYATLGNSSE